MTDTSTTPITPPQQDDDHRILPAVSLEALEIYLQTGHIGPICPLPSEPAESTPSE